MSSKYTDWDVFAPNSSATVVVGGRLRKVSADGVILWDRIYIVPEESEEDGSTERESAFLGVIEDDNGDLFAYGHIDTDSSATSTDQGHWFVRTDSYGCIIEGCEVTSIDLIERQRIDYFSVVNPVLNQIEISISEEYSNNDTEFFLYSLTGQELSRQKNIGTNLNISVEGYTKGMYLLQMRDKGKILQTKKIIIQ